MDTHEESKDTTSQIIAQPGKLDFALLRDKNHEVVDRYGIFNPAEVSFKPGIPERRLDWPPAMPPDLKLSWSNISSL